MKRLLLITLLAVTIARAQSIRPKTQATTATAPTFNVGSSLPPTCTLGSLFFLTISAPGQNIYGCTATGVWTLQGGGGTGGGGTGGGGVGTVLSWASLTSSQWASLTSSQWASLTQ